MKTVSWKIQSLLTSPYNSSDKGFRDNMLRIFSELKETMVQVQDILILEMRELPHDLVLASTSRDKQNIFRKGIYSLMFIAELFTIVKFGNSSNIQEQMTE